MKRRKLITKGTYNPIFHFLMGIASAVTGTILLSWPLLALFVQVQKTYETVNLTLGQVMHNYSQLLWFLLWPFKHELKMDNFASSSNAIEHFTECKYLFELAVIVFILGLIVLRFKPNFDHLSKTWALIFMLIPVVVVPFAVANFDTFFVTFHHMIFHNNNWLFNPLTDPIINVLTEGFFAACFSIFGIIYELYFARFLLNK
ncbi:TIGR01906 family membrane protein [Lactobacillus jensenii]|jgi:TIGR01906 family protein|uniref:TIGR01906 family membrane protein n=2 Tax=Lactobacillus TaxID=1578 RepID=A0A5N1ICC9_LACJE|nr:TIGR01906 family membrane protein [Lactobacillus jensenii]EEQ67643.1 TIGR01906 family protein [Lactobacillus jensenii 1153]ERJ41778.1 membrane protein [Lactobacillus jensenii MD IIE-70(2)]MCT7680878.1 TIGR01906 family membrane protein [Lactobacillus crispatus]APT15127.1 hypothetical protein BUE77_06910 [Lactobacillus jensenii]EEQ24116.1 TIGR01906 family protein [Lactobacillus jensenii 269-3]